MSSLLDIWQATDSSQGQNPSTWPLTTVLPQNNLRNSLLLEYFFHLFDVLSFSMNNFLAYFRTYISDARRSCIVYLCDEIGEQLCQISRPFNDRDIEFKRFLGKAVKHGTPRWKVETSWYNFPRERMIEDFCTCKLIFFVLKKARCAEHARCGGKLEKVWYSQDTRIYVYIGRLNRVFRCGTLLNFTTVCVIC